MYSQNKIASAYKLSNITKSFLEVTFLPAKAFNGNLVIPAGKLVIPAGKLVIQADKLVIPAGKLVMPAGKLVIPAGKLVIPAGKLVIPAGKLVIPAGKLVIPAGKLVIPAGELVSQADKLDIPAAKLVIPAHNTFRVTSGKHIRPWCNNTFSCSTHLSMELILLINVKMPTIVAILTFISRINTKSEMSFFTRVCSAI